MNTYTVQQSAFTNFFTTNTASAPFWLVVRVYLGYEWLMAGWEKVTNPAWFGGDAGAAMQGFVQGALAKRQVSIPMSRCGMPHFSKAPCSPLVTWSNAIAVGELLVGLGPSLTLYWCRCILRLLYESQLPPGGHCKQNPIMLVLALGIILARRVAGHWVSTATPAPHCVDKNYRTTSENRSGPLLLVQNGLGMPRRHMIVGPAGRNDWPGPR